MSRSIGTFLAGAALAAWAAGCRSPGETRAAARAPERADSARAAGSPWERVGGLGARGSWDGGTDTVIQQVRVLREFGGRLYAGIQSAWRTARGELWRYDGRRWEKVGGGGVRGSWRDGRVMAVMCLADDGRSLYAGTGAHLGMAQVWRFDGERWEQVGGDRKRGGWGWDVDAVHSLTFFRGELYAGLTAEDRGEARAPLWRFDGEAWHPVTGESGAGWGWGAGEYIMPYIGVAGPDRFYLGMAGRTPSSGDVWRFDGAAWEQIGGDGLRGSWKHEGSTFVEDLILADGALLAALNGTYTGGRRDPPVWRFDGEAWSPVGDVPEAWQDSGAWIYNKLLVHRGALHLGVGGWRSSVGLWRLGPAGAWERMEGWKVPEPPRPDTARHALWIYTLAEFRDRLYLGLASSGDDGMGQVWRWDGPPPGE